MTRKKAGKFPWANFPKRAEISIWRRRFQIVPEIPGNLRGKSREIWKRKHPNLESESRNFWIFYSIEVEFGSVWVPSSLYMCAVGVCICRYGMFPVTSLGMGCWMLLKMNTNRNWNLKYCTRRTFILELQGQLLKRQLNFQLYCIDLHVT